MKCQKVFQIKFPNCPKNVLGYFFRKFLFAKIPKTPKVVPKSVQKCFEHVLGYFFREISLCEVFHVGSSLRNVFKKISKFKKRPKSICPNVFSTCFGGIFSRIYFAQCSMEGRVCETFLKIFQNSKDAQNRSQKRPNVFWTCFGVIFSEIFFAQCSM